MGLIAYGIALWDNSIMGLIHYGTNIAAISPITLLLVLLVQ